MEKTLSDMPFFEEVHTSQPTWLPAKHACAHKCFLSGLVFPHSPNLKLRFVVIAMCVRLTDDGSCPQLQCQCWATALMFFMLKIN